MTGPTEFTSVPTAREQVTSLVTPTTETEQLGLVDADGRRLAEEITASRDVPHYERAAMDGYAVRASETVGAGDRSPVKFDIDDEAGVETATRVDTGEQLPTAADAVVRVEDTERVDDDELTVFTAVAPGENVAPVGEDVEAGTTLFEVGHRLRPADLGLLRAVGVEEVAVYRRPEVVLVPTGDELVASDPEPGETVATNGLTVGRYVERWGGRVTVRDPVPDDDDALREAITDAADADLVATLGGTSMGERDRIPGVIDDVGAVHVHGVGLRPGHPAGVGSVDETPVLMLPGYPVGCLVTAMALLRPAVGHAARLPVTKPPATEATLARKIASEPGMRTYARVALDDGTARPTQSRGSGVLSSVTEADGWVVVPESAEGFERGETVQVEDWERAIPSDARHRHPDERRSGEQGSAVRGGDE